MNFLKVSRTASWYELADCTTLFSNFAGLLYLVLFKVSFIVSEHTYAVAWGDLEVTLEICFVHILVQKAVAALKLAVEIQIP